MRWKDERKENVEKGVAAVRWRDVDGNGYQAEDRWAARCQYQPKMTTHNTGLSLPRLAPPVMNAFNLENKCS